MDENESFIHLSNNSSKVVHRRPPEGVREVVKMQFYDLEQPFFRALQAQLPSERAIFSPFGPKKGPIAALQGGGQPTPRQG